MRKEEHAGVSQAQEFVRALVGDDLLDEDYYASRYMLRRPADRSQIASHYVANSVLDLRTCSPNFDPIFYLTSNEDVETSRIPPLLHYAMYGRAEGRQTRPISYRPVKRSLVMQDLRERAMHPSEINAAPRLAITLHIFYPEYFTIFRHLLAAMPYKFDLFVSLTDAKFAGAARSFERLPQVNRCEIELLPNKGRNFLGFFTRFRSKLSDYDLVAHAHSKKSLYTGASRTNWGTYLCAGVLGSEDYVRSVVTLFRDDANVALVSSERHYQVPFWASHWLRNYGTAKPLLDKLGVASSDGFIDYPIGSMFWMRPTAFRELLDHPFRESDFPEETSQTDNTLQHALERIIGVLPTAKGLDFVKFSSSEGRFIFDSDLWKYDYMKLSRVGAQDAIGAARVVSFDLFDTLVVRDAAQVDEAKLEPPDSDWPSQLGDYQSHRDEAELDVRREMKGLGDVRIQDIIAALDRRTGIGFERASLAIAGEAARDLALFRRRETVLSLYNYAINRGKRVILVSDTYYSESYIRKILASLSIPAPSAIYLSCERQARKDRGDLWSIILENEGEAAGLLHFGDNVVSDIQNPTDRGIPVIFVCKAIEKLSLLGITKRTPTRSEWPFVRQYVAKFGDDPFFS